MKEFFLFNKLFGWDYIYYRDFYNGVARVYKDGANRAYYKMNGCSYRLIEDKDQVIWLTCSPEKYFETRLDIYGEVGLRKATNLPPMPEVMPLSEGLIKNAGVNPPAIGPKLDIVPGAQPPYKE